MKKNNLIWIIICNILGALLLGSWLASTPTAGYHGPWLALDQSVFYFFNQKLAQGTAFTYFIALLICVPLMWLPLWRCGDFLQLLPQKQC